MTELIFILTDFCAPAVGEIAMMEQARAAILPRLPALETLLARGHHESLPHDWRAWLAARLDVAPLAPAATVAAAWSAGDNDDAAGADAGAQPARYHHWLATPVHFFAGIDRIQLHPAGLLQLPTAEQHTLAGEFAQVFGDSPWRLKARGARELLLAGPPLYASGLDPAGFAGDDPTGGLPQGPDAAALKRLGSEIELWLHEHPLNLERTRRGELAISTLWLWGGQIVPATATATAPAVAAALATPPICAMPPHPVGPLSTRLFGRDTYAEALWRLHGASAQPLPRSLAAGPALMDGPADSVLLYPMRHDGSVTAALAQLEQHWLTGAAAALRRRRIEAVQLVIGSSAYRLRWRDLGRLWRARAPWWEKM